MKKSDWFMLGLTAKIIFTAILLLGHFSSVFAQDIIIEPPPLSPIVTPQPGPPVIPLLAPITIAAHQVDAIIDGPIAKVHLTQIFRNDANHTVEGTYVFPLPEDAAVSDFQMTIDGKTLEGKLLSKDEARRIYETIVRQQRDPALLEYVGRGLFQTSVFPIPAGASRTLELSYAQILPQRDGLYQFRYPLRSQHANATRVEALKIQIELRNQPGLRTIYSPNYNINIERVSNTGAKIAYATQNVQPESDFQLLFGTTKAAIGLNVLTYKPAGEDGFFALLAAPGVEVDPQKLVQRDVVLVLDVSGSMQGEKIVQARKAADFVVNHLNPGDHFNLISFSTGVQLWKSSLQPIDAATAKDAHAWINRLTATGSTDINRALLEALGQMQDPADGDNRPAYLLFMTDGLPTQGETDTQRIIDNALNNKPAQRSIRFFTFGVGFDVNTDLLDTLSQALGGRSSYVKPDEQIDEKIGQFYSQISLPVLSDVTLDFGKQAVIDDVYPYPLSDLFAGEQLVVVGRYHSGADLTVTLRGLVNNQKIIYQYPHQHFVASGGEPLVARLWATRKIGALLAQVRRSGANQTTIDKELIDEITKLSLQYGIVTPYTSYLVEEPSVVNSQTSGAPQAPTANEPRSIYAQGANAIASKVDAAAAAPASGAAAVAASEARTQLETATNVQENQSVRYVNGKTFMQQGVVTTKDGRTVKLWVDTLYTDKTPIEKVVFGSDRYFALAKQPQLTRWLAISTELVVVIDKNKAIRITTEP